MKKIINIGNIKIICGLAIIILIIAMPFIIENIDEERMVEGSYKTKKIEFTLDSDVKDIEAVKRLHRNINSIFTSNGNLYVKNDYNDTLLIENNTAFDNSLINKQVMEMNSIQGFNNIFDEFISNSRTNMLGPEYTVQIGDIITDKYICSNKEIGFIYDQKENKILSFTVKADNLSEISEEKKVQLLEAMVGYLNIKIVGDWMYDGCTLVSNKAHLRVRCDINNDIISVGVSSDKGYYIN